MNFDKIDRIPEILKKVTDQLDLSAEEEQLLKHWRQESVYNEAVYQEVTDQKQFAKATTEYSALAKRLEASHAQQYNVGRNRLRTSILRYGAVAASLIVIIGIGYTLLHKKRPTPAEVAGVPAQPVQDIHPGNQHAVLTLANNKQVVLNGQDSIITQAGASGIKIHSHELNYTPTGDRSLSSVTRPDEGANTVTTPRGGNSYRITLPDGSTVDLNAASSLRFPVAFSSDKPRIVELTGEAYFQIAQQLQSGSGEKNPFIVKTGDQFVKVLGTKFNVNNYQDREATIITTLLEGSVEISIGQNKGLLKPGQRSLVNVQNNKVLLEQTKAENSIKWVSGNFRFDKAPIQQVMKEISRWYDVSFEFDKAIAKEDLVKALITGNIDRNINLSLLLKNLTYVAGNDLNFSLRNKTIYVTKQ